MRKITLLFVSCFMALQLLAQNHKPFKEVDQNLLIKETQQSLSNGNEIRLIWWIPTEFWQVVYANQPGINQSVADQIVNSLGKYTLIGIVDGKIQTGGHVDYKSESFVRKNLMIYNKDNKAISAFDESKMDETCKMMLQMINPMLKNMLGDMGDHFYFIAFANEENQALINPYQDNGNRVYYNKNEIGFELPLSSLLSDKVCPIDKKKMNGGWIYCPKHGNALTTE